MCIKSFNLSHFGAANRSIQISLSHTWSANSSTTSKSIASYSLLSVQDPSIQLIQTVPRLLRKVDFTSYKSDQNHRDAAVIRRYAIQKPSDYTKYNRICGSLRYALSPAFFSLCQTGGRAPHRPSRPLFPSLSNSEKAQ